jgi:ribosomal-protein-alanine N-acetyltransferase
MVHIHNMTRNDIAEVLEIEKLSFATPWSEEAFNSEVERNLSARYVVAKQDGRVVGYGGMWIIIDEGHITNVAIHPDFRGMGIGRLVVDALVRIAKRERVRAMTLEVRKTNTTAQRLYREFDFEPAGIRPGYYGDNGEDAVIMWKWNVQGPKSS